MLFAVGFLPYMLLFGALVVHVGSELALRRDLQGVAAAAALASVIELPESSAQAVNEAQSNAGANMDGLTSTVVTTDTDGTYHYVTVTVTKPNESLFGGFLEISPSTITATAVARVLPPSLPGLDKEFFLYK